jgi:ferredoxin-nitrate reductase
MFRAWASPAAAFRILQQLSRGQPCDFSGIRDYDQIEAAGGIQWPFPVARPMQPADRERRLFADGKFFTTDGRARFHFDEPRPMPEPPDRDYPLLLMTGRGSSAQWHTGSRTNKSAILRKLAPTVLHVEINPADAAALGIADGARTEVRSRRAAIEAVAFVTRVVQPGQVFLPLHFPDVNKLTFPAYDPHSRQPSYKACAVALKPLPC